jgi:hypothetical protein
MTLSPSAFQLWTGRFLSSVYCADFLNPGLGFLLFVDTPSFFLPGIVSASSVDHVCRLPTRGFFFTASCDISIGGVSRSKEVSTTGAGVDFNPKQTAATAANASSDPAT